MQSLNKRQEVFNTCRHRKKKLLEKQFKLAEQIKPQIELSLAQLTPSLFQIFFVACCMILVIPDTFNVYKYIYHQLVPTYLVPECALPLCVYVNLLALYSMALNHHRESTDFVLLSTLNGREMKRARSTAGIGKPLFLQYW